MLSHSIFFQNSIPIAPKQASELKAIMSQFPVSSGKQHQKVENNWVPVTVSNTSTISMVATIPKTVITLQKQIQEQLPELARSKVTSVEQPQSKPLDSVLSKPYDWKSDDHYSSKSVVAEFLLPTLVSFVVQWSRTVVKRRFQVGQKPNVKLKLDT